MGVKIKWEGNTQRFCEQKKGKLLLAESVISKQINRVIVELVGKPVSEKSVRQYIHCVYIGENGITFDDIIGYGGSRLIYLNKYIGKWFDIDTPDKPTTQQKLEMEN